MLSKGWEEIKLQEEAISEILVADADSESGAEASDGRFWRRRRITTTRTITTTTTAAAAAAVTMMTTTTTTSLSISLTTGCTKWQITNLGTASRKEYKHSSFCWSSKRCEKKWGSTHQQRQLATVCDDVFHRNFSSAGRTDQHILPATLKRTSRI